MFSMENRKMFSLETRKMFSCETDWCISENTWVLVMDDGKTEKCCLRKALKCFPETLRTFANLI